MSVKKFSAAEYNEAHAENDAMSVYRQMVDRSAPSEPFDAVLEHQDPQLDVLSVTDEAAIEALDTDTVEALEASGDEIIEDAVLELQASQGSFEEMLAAITDEDAIAKAVEVGNAIDERMDFEKAKGNDNIQKALAKSRKQLATPTAARVLIACSVDPSMINRSVHEGHRYNVYALGKLADAIHGLANGQVNNAINIACMKSLFRFKAAGKDFTGEMAKAAASDKIRVDAGLRGMLVRHTVSENTSSTQASSTMQALTTLGIVTRSGSHKNPTFNLTETAVVEKLRSVCGEMAIAA